MAEKWTGPERRHVERRHDLNGHIPWPVRAIVLMGVPAAISCFMVYHIVTKQDSAINDIKLRQEALIQMIVVHSEATKEIAQEQHLHGLRMERLIQLLCVTNATTDIDRRSCLDVQ